MPPHARALSSPEIQARLAAIIFYLRNVAGPEDELLQKLIYRQREMDDVGPDAVAAVAQPV